MWQSLPNEGIQMATAPREKRHRLPAAAYVGARRVSMTACVAGRTRLFASPELVDVFATLLIACADRHDCDVVVYCFMPDHLHVVMAGRCERSNCKRAFEDFKYETGLWLARTGSGASWQKDYHDHILREREDWLTHVRYILANPVRAGIAAEPDEYLGSGSSLYAVRELLGGLV